MKVLEVGDRKLRGRNKPVQKIDSEKTLLIIDKLEKIILKRKLYSLSAPQIGESKRIFCTKIPKDHLRVFINPEIIRTSSKKVNVKVSCPSIAKGNLAFEVIRSEYITIQAYDRKGRFFRLEADGELSYEIEHMIDHLDGVLLFDKFTNPKSIETVKNLQFRKPIKSKLIDFSFLEKPPLSPTPDSYVE